MSSSSPGGSNAPHPPSRQLADEFKAQAVIRMLQEADRASVSEVAKEHGVSDQTLYNWRKHFCGLEPSDVKRLRQLEQENARLEKLVAERDPEIEVMKAIAAKKW